jgi:hypothetical protein
MSLELMAVLPPFTLLNNSVRGVVSATVDGRKLVKAPDEQAMAQTEQDATQGNAGTENPVAQGTSKALHLPGSAEEFVALYKAQEVRNNRIVMVR